MAEKIVDFKIKTSSGFDILQPKTVISAVVGLSNVLSTINSNLVTTGTVDNTSITPSPGDNILLADASNSHKIRRGPSLSSDTEHENKFLRQDGSWQTVSTNESSFKKIALGTPSPGSTIAELWTTIDNAGGTIGSTAYAANTNVATLFIIYKGSTTYDFRVFHSGKMYVGTGVASGTNYATMISATYLVLEVVKTVSGTRFLREDGTWQTVPDNNTTYTFDVASNGVLTVTPSGGAQQNVTVYSHPTGDGNLHIPATGAGNNGKVLTAGSTAGSLSWATPVVADDAITNSKLANMATGRIKGRVSTGTGDPEDLTKAQVQTFLELGSAAYTNTSAYVPMARTVNSKALSANITLNLEDVGDGSTRKLPEIVRLI